MADQWITLPGGEKLNFDWKHSEPERFHARLASYYVRNRDAQPADKAHCACRYRGSIVPLQIRPSGDSGLYHFALWPQTGPRHEPTCAFFTPDPEVSGRSGYVDGVLKEDGTGEVHVRLSLSLNRKKPPGTDETAATSSGRSGRARQRKMRALGLLHLLWERAGLSQWKPHFNGHRTIPTSLGRIIGAARLIHTQRSLLSDSLVPIAPDPERQPRRFHAIVNARTPAHRLVMVGFIEEARKSEKHDSVTIVLTGQRDGYRTFLSANPALWEQIQKSAPWAAKEITAPARTLPVAALFLISARRVEAGKWKGSVVADIEDGAMMVLSPEFIPVDSSHELRIANALVEAERAFYKPLRFDAGRDLVLPDFILTDTLRSAGYPMEVFGRTDEAYLARKAEKTAYYDTTFGQGGWWSWDVTRGDAPPPFPEKRAYGRRS